MLSGLPGTRSRGFTLVELMTALGISAILVAIAVPTMRAFIENSRIRAASESLQNGLALARNEVRTLDRIPNAGTSDLRVSADAPIRRVSLSHDGNLLAFDTTAQFIDVDADGANDLPGAHLDPSSLVFVLIHSVLWPVALNTHSGFKSVSNTLRSFVNPSVPLA